MSRWVRTAAVLGSTATLLAAGCLHGDQPAKAPDAAKLLFDADPQSVRVQMVRQPSAPLTVDWSMQDRKALEARVRQKGAIVVRFDDKKLEPLPDCHPPGSYVFTGVTHGHEFIDARTTAELAANFPLTAVRLGGRYAEAEQMSADLHVVGMANLDRPLIKHAEVDGAQCQGATHVVTEVTHGGFRFGSSREIGGGAHADVAGIGGATANTTSMAGRLSEDGEVASCKQATWKDAEPPAQCGGVIRIRLVPIETKETKESGETCPTGLRWTGSGCASEQLAQKAAKPAPVNAEAMNVNAIQEQPAAAKTSSFKCDPTHAGECYAQCTSGNADSCASLGLMFLAGTGVPKKDAQLGQRLIELSCKGGSSEGCLSAGVLASEQKRPAEYLSFSAKSCQMGNSGGCTNEAYALWHGIGGNRPDHQRAFELFSRACNLREFVACNNAAVMMFFDTTGTLKRNPALACKMFGQSCESGNTTSCANVGVCLEHGIDRPKNADLAFKQYAAACDAGAPFGCVWGALLLETSNPNNAKAAGIALQQYERTCLAQMEGLNSCVSSVEIKTALPRGYTDDQVDRHACDGGANQGLACYNAAIVHERGLAGPANPARAAQLLQRACTEFGTKKACRPAR